MCCQTARCDAEGKSTHYSLPQFGYCGYGAGSARAGNWRGRRGNRPLPIPTQQLPGSVAASAPRPVLIDCAPARLRWTMIRWLRLSTSALKPSCQWILVVSLPTMTRCSLLSKPGKDLFKPNNDIQKAYGRCIVIADAAHAFGGNVARSDVRRDCRFHLVPIPRGQKPSQRLRAVP